MENKTKMLTLVIVILVAIVVGLSSYIISQDKSITENASSQQEIATPQPETMPEAEIVEIPARAIDEVIALPDNELISMEEAAKIGTEINAKIAAGTITEEEGEEQLTVLRSHIAPPAPAETK